jgi:rhodanese-related sulfurtransferase
MPLQPILRLEELTMLGSFSAWLRRSRAPEIRPEELGAALRSASPLVLIDMRSAEAYAAGHLPGAVRIAPEQLPIETRRLALPTPIVLY